MKFTQKQTFVLIIIDINKHDVVSGQSRGSDAHTNMAMI